MRVFVDTNVLLDVLARREPHFTDAARLWSLAESGQIRASVSSISFVNTYYVIRKASGRKKAADALRLLRDVFEPIAADSQILNQALDSRLADFEDAVQYFCALRGQADCLVTRNPDDFPKRPLPILSAAEFLALLAETQEGG
jgi:predicted nucleic acid-binding protein